MGYPQPTWSRQNEFFRATPITVTVIGIWILCFLISAVGFPLLVRLFAFLPTQIPNVVTGFFTYPLVMPAGSGASGIINLLFAGLMLFMFGGSLERAWGAKGYLYFLIGATLAAALMWELGLLLLFRQLQPLADPWLLIASVVVAWAWSNPEQTILLYFVLPIKARWVGWLTIALLFFSYASMTVGASPLLPIVGVFSLGGVGFALGYIWYQRKWAWIPRQRNKKTSRAITHPSSTSWGSFTRPYREWQRKRRIAHLQRTIHFDD